MLSSLVHIYRLAGCDRFIAANHGLHGLAVPLQVDLGLFAGEDAVAELIHHADPLIKICILNGITVVGSSAVAVVGAEAVGLNDTLGTHDGEVDLHTLGMQIPVDRQLSLGFVPGPRRVQQEFTTIFHSTCDIDYILFLNVTNVGILKRPKA